MVISKWGIRPTYILPRPNISHFIIPIYKPRLH
jgi:hypothetical protein